MLEERRAAGGSVVRAINVEFVSGELHFIRISPDSHALLVLPLLGDPARVIIFD